MAKGSGGWRTPSSGPGGKGNAGNVQSLQAKLMEGLAKAQEDLTNATVEGSAGGGVVKVIVTGDQRVQSISLAPEAVDPADVEMLQDLVVVAVNEALEKAQALQQQLMGSLTGGIKIPGLT